MSSIKVSHDDTADQDSIDFGRIAYCLTGFARIIKFKTNKKGEIHVDSLEEGFVKQGFMSGYARQIEVFWTKGMKSFRRASTKVGYWKP